MSLMCVLPIAVRCNLRISPGKFLKKTVNWRLSIERLASGGIQGHHKEGSASLATQLAHQTAAATLRDPDNIAIGGWVAFS